MYWLVNLLDGLVIGTWTNFTCTVTRALMNAHRISWQLFVVKKKCNSISIMFFRFDHVVYIRSQVGVGITEQRRALRNISTTYTEENELLTLNGMCHSNFDFDLQAYT